jgi:hypothetical protein
MSAPNWVEMTESELRDAEAPWPKSFGELQDFIDALAKRTHDYGTCVYAVSLSAAAAFNLMAHLLGITGFQAGFADLDVLRRTRSLKHGFRVLDYGKLLYPQHTNRESFPHLEDLLDEVGPQLATEARKLLAEKNEYTHENVIAHWKALAERFPAEAEVAS